jgi:(p)ppGpp synthase/HD superfamily hydrolase
MDSKKIDAALQIALDAHRDQLDKQGMPYILHVLRVALMCRTEEAMLAALCHDVLEDVAESRKAAFHNRILSELGPEIVSVVSLLTRPLTWTYEEYITRVISNPVARAVKKFDILDNLDPDRPGEGYTPEPERVAKYLRALFRIQAARCHRSL